MKVLTYFFCFFLVSFFLFFENFGVLILETSEADSWNASEFV